MDKMLKTITCTRWIQNQRPAQFCRTDVRMAPCGQMKMKKVIYFDEDCWFSWVAPARFADKFFKGIEEQLSKQTKESH